MDDMDRKILSVLQSDSSQSVAEMAEKVGLSHTPFWRRLKRLEKDGVIRERVSILDPQKLGLDITVFANIKLRQHDEETLEAFEREVAAFPEVVECYSMSGETDYVVRALVASIEEYERLLKRKLLHLPGVVAINSHFALKCIKLTTRLPL
ncbi:Lrp/AsnC family transcriptional regulator [Pelagibacterium sp. 26DY04]|uniref:Lrp/AsnC family transcriptional regulator n=1 Tax=Pelagibacterium sp. 26DY04 TaxID=2967130 RepID=UPI002815A03F|nr:Lrp/AsnC family transcriptional regulator [Pelagibacterium sp. 26DY04]WMT88488.1 Lrp/AsnC family transcriptional regulator [Pelagibacterium sp. 26DY04]